MTDEPGFYPGVGCTRLGRFRLHIGFHDEEFRMARITLRQLLDYAAEHGYGVPAFNINNMEQGLAALAAAPLTLPPAARRQSRRPAPAPASNRLQRGFSPLSKFGGNDEP